MQPSELVDLIVAVSVLPLVLAARRRTAVLRESPWWPLSYGFILISYVMTIAEGVGGAVGEWLNLLEHASLLASGAALLLFARELYTQSTQSKQVDA